MILINTVDAKYFTIDGVKFARIYQPLRQGSEAIGIYSIFDTKLQLVNSTKYNEFNIDNLVYNNQEDAISALLNVIWSGISDYEFGQLENRVNNLEENQITGVEVYSTYATLPATGTLLVSYKVSNDSTLSNNGYYHWSGSAYIKDAELNNGEVEAGEVEAVTGGKIFDSIKILNQEKKLLWFINSGDFRGQLTESYNSVSDELTISWNQPLLLIMANNKYAIIQAGSIIIPENLGFVYIDYTFSTNSAGNISVGTWSPAGTPIENTSTDIHRVILFIRGAYSKSLEYSLLSNEYIRQDVEELKTLNESINTKVLQHNESLSLINKLTSFPIVGVWLTGGSFTVSGSWRTQELTCVEGDEIYYNLYSITTGCLLTFLDESDTVLLQIVQSGSSTEIAQTGSAIAPSGTAKVAASTFGTKVNLSYVGLSELMIDAAERISILEENAGSLQSIITVDKNLIEDEDARIFNTISAALTIATGKDTIYLYGEASNPYEEISLEMPDGITIIGIGTPYIKGSQSDNESVSNVVNNSTIDANESCTLENLIISCKNMRYPIHADFSSGGTTKNIKNCKFIHYGNKGAYAYQVSIGGDPDGIFRAMSAWGGGTKAGDRVYIDNCYFESWFRAFSTHNNSDFDTTKGASIVHIRNSKMLSHGIDRDGANTPFPNALHIQNLVSNTNDQVIVSNCDLNGYVCFQGAPSHEFITDTQKFKTNLEFSGKLI